MSLKTKNNMNRNIIFPILWLLIPALWIGCNRAELISVRDKMEENIETARRIEAMRVQLVIDFNNAASFYQAMEKKLYVTGIEKKDVDYYVVTYSDHSEYIIKSTSTPLITFAADGEVIINGVPTGCKPVNGTDKHGPVITIDEDGYYVVDGVRTQLLKGKPGNAGKTPNISIDSEGYYCMDGERIIPEICLKGQEGQDGTAPVPTIVLNDAEGKYELLIDGEPTAPPTFVSPEDGQDGTAGTSGDYIKQITVSDNNELIFTYSDGTTRKSSQIILSDLKFTVEQNDIKNLRIGQPYRIKYKVETDYSNNPVAVNQMFTLKGWQVLITPPDPTTKEGYVTVTPVSGTTLSGRLQLMAMDSQQETVIEEIQLSVSPYRIELPALAVSGVHDVRTADGYKIAEITREYIKGANAVLWVVYPCNDSGSDYGEGFVAANGGSVHHNGDFYTNGNKAPVIVVKLESGKVSATVSGTMQPTVITRSKVTDVDGNQYNIFKVGTQYWMQENLKVKRYRTKQRILPLTAVQTGTSGACAYYQNNEAAYASYGALYNGYAVQFGNLAPEGWHIPDKSEWQTLQASNPNFNTLGFSAMLAGYWSGTFAGISASARWWTADAGQYVFQNGINSVIQYGTAPESDYYSIRCVKNK